MINTIKIMHAPRILFFFSFLNFFSRHTAAHRCVCVCARVCAMCIHLWAINSLSVKSLFFHLVFFLLLGFASDFPFCAQKMHFREEKEKWWMQTTRCTVHNALHERMWFRWNCARHSNNLSRSESTLVRSIGIICKPTRVFLKCNGDQRQTKKEERAVLSFHSFRQIRCDVTQLFSSTRKYVQRKNLFIQCKQRAHRPSNWCYDTHFQLIILSYRRT